MGGGEDGRERERGGSGEKEGKAWRAERTGRGEEGRGEEVGGREREREREGEGKNTSHSTFSSRGRV